MRSSHHGLWKSPNFVSLWIGQTISLFGSQIGGGALRYAALLVLAASPAELGLLTAAATLPVLLLSLPAGALVDRMRRRPLLIAADLGRAALLLAIPIAYALGALRMELLYAIALLTGALTLVFDTAYHAFLPTVVSRDQLVEGNSKLSVSDSLSEVAGPPLGGALVQIISAPFAILADSFSFLCSGLLISRVRVTEEIAPSEESTSPWREAVAGMPLALGNRYLRPLLAVQVTQALAGGIIGALYDVFLVRELGFTPLLVGITIGVGGASALGGALLAERMTRRLGLGRTLVTALLLGGVSTLLIPLAAGPWALLMLLASQMTDLVNTIYGISQVSLQQSIVPDRLLGRVRACFALLPTTAVLLGALATGPLVAAVGTRGALMAGALLCVIATLWVLLSPLARLRSIHDLT